MLLSKLKKYDYDASVKIPLLPREGDKTPPFIIFIFIFSLFICICICHCHSKVFLKYSQENFDKEKNIICIDSYLKPFLEIISVSEIVFLKVGKSKSKKFFIRIFLKGKIFNGIGITEREKNFHYCLCWER